MMKPTVICAALLLAACGPDETISGYADQQVAYVLTDINDTPVSFRATIRFPQKGEITGTGPCNSFRASQIVPYPWFEIGPIAATRRACPDLNAETTYFATLATMTFAEVTGDVLILSNSEDQSLVFQAE